MSKRAYQAELQAQFLGWRHNPEIVSISGYRLAADMISSIVAKGNKKASALVAAAHAARGFALDVGIANGVHVGRRYADSAVDTVAPAAAKYLLLGLKFAAG